MSDEEFYSLSDKDRWQTPDEITEMLASSLDISLDPCAGLWTFIADENWTVDTPNEAPPDDVTAVESSGDYANAYEKGDRVLRCGSDSLERPWDTGGIAFVNPPFSMKTEFIQKTVDEVEAGNIDGAVVLTPATPDVKSWWHGLLAPNAEITWFSAGRVGFVDPETGEKADSPTFGTALHFLGDAHPEDAESGLLDDLEAQGDLLWRRRRDD